MKTTYRKSWPGNLFQLLTLTPSSVSSGVILLQRPYISLSSHILLILRQEITAMAEKCAEMFQILQQKKTAQFW